MRPDLTQATTVRLNPSKLTGIGSTATSDQTVFALTSGERVLLSVGLGSTALRSRSIEESLKAVRAIAELSSEGSAEVQDRVDQARSMIESLPEPIGVTVVAIDATIDAPTATQI
jgi:hypothetical protein